MSKKLTYAEIEAENSRLKGENLQLRRTGTSIVWANVANNLIRWGAVCVISCFIYLSISALAGKTTLSNIVVSFLGNLTVSQSLAYIFGGGGVVYGMSQKKLRHNTVERLQSRNQDLERRLDPNRSSSQLTSTGETNPEDQD